MGHNTTAVSPAPTVTGGGMAGWALVATVAFDGVGTPHKRLSVFRALSPSPGSGTVKITFAGVQANCQWIVSQWQGVETGGTNGSGAIAQAGSARGDNVSGLTVALGAFADPNDVAYGVFGVRNSAASITPGAGFTEIAKPASGETPPSALEAERSAGDNTIDARWTKLNGGALGIEIRAAAPAVIPVASVEVSPDPASVAVGGTVQLSAALQDAGGEPLSGRTVTWTTDNAQVATVSATGLVSRRGGGQRYRHRHERREERNLAGHRHVRSHSGVLGGGRTRYRHRLGRQHGAAHRHAQGCGRAAAHRSDRHLDDRQCPGGDRVGQPGSSPASPRGPRRSRRPAKAKAGRRA